MSDKLVFSTAIARNSQGASLAREASEALAGLATSGRDYFYFGFAYYFYAYFAGGALRVQEVG